jgi:SH3 domain
LKKKDGVIFHDSTFVFSQNTIQHIFFFSKSTSTPKKEEKRARALYDFEAAEDNELTFKAGEIGKNKLMDQKVRKEKQMNFLPSSLTRSVCNKDYFA